MPRSRPDSLPGTKDIGGFVHATTYCPIFDPRPHIGNFIPIDKEIRKSVLSAFNPFKDPGFIYIVNILTLPYYEISEQYKITQEGFDGENWNELFRLGVELRSKSKDLGHFLQKIVTRVRLGDLTGWSQDSSRRYIMQVTTPTFGQILPDESIAYPVIPVSHSEAASRELTEIAVKITDLNQTTDQRTAKTTRP